MWHGVACIHYMMSSHVTIIIFWNIHHFFIVKTSETLAFFFLKCGKKYSTWTLSTLSTVIQFYSRSSSCLVVTSTCQLIFSQPFFLLLLSLVTTIIFLTSVRSPVFFNFTWEWCHVVFVCFTYFAKYNSYSIGFLLHIILCTSGRFRFL